MKNLISYFAFTRKERNGIIFILIFIVLLIVLPLFYPLLIKQTPTNSRQFEKEIALLKIKSADSSRHYDNKTDADNDNDYPNYYGPQKKYSDKIFTGNMFVFDPNTLSAEGWKKLGIKDKTVQTIQKYVSKGGRFYQPEDIKKIWGLRPDEVDRLLPYVQIQPKENKTYTKNESNNYKTKPSTYLPAIIDINTADTTAFIALPGIGSKLAQRIITFREKLGGFYKIEQIGETFGLPDSTYQKIKSQLSINNATVKQLNINVATLYELKAHPYIRYNIANAIVQYRNQHGNFNNIEELKKIMLITEDVYNKIKYYLTK